MLPWNGTKTLSQIVHGLASISQLFLLLLVRDLLFQFLNIFSRQPRSELVQSTTALFEN